MHKLREALERVAHEIGLTTPLLARARRRAKRFRKRGEENRARQVVAQERADRARANGHPARANRQDRIAARCDHRAARSEAKAVYWRGRVKVYLQRLHDLTVSQTEIVAEILKWREEHGVVAKGNKATGGTSEERKRILALHAVSACALGKRPNFYSQSGAVDVKHPVTGESYGERSDCSSFATSLFFGAGDKDPNGGNYRGTMYTGTLPNRGRKVSEAEMKRHKFGLVLYGSAPYHHVECWIGPGDRTAGHGSAPVDFGVIDLFGDGDFDCYVYD